MLDAGILELTELPADAMAMDDRLRVRFFVDTEWVNPNHSRDKGYPVVEPRTMVGIMPPDEDGQLGNSEVTYIADETYKRRFPREWGRFVATNQEYTGPGTSLKMWPPMSVGAIATLADRGIFSVEQLAEAESDEIVEQWQPKAREWLRNAAGMDVMAARVRELEAMLASGNVVSPTTSLMYPNSVAAMSTEPLILADKPAALESTFGVQTSLSNDLNAALAPNGTVALQPRPRGRPPKVT